MEISNKWYNTYDLLKVYLAASHNKYPIYNIFDDIADKLHSFIHTQKRLYVNDELPEIKIELLESLINWNWNITITKKWFQKLKSLKRYVEMTKIYPTENNKDIYHFYINYRNKYKHKSLSLEKCALLEMIPNWKLTVLKSSIWYENYEKLSHFINEHNAYPKQTESTPICNFYIHQQYKYISDTISDIKGELLELLPNWTLISLKYAVWYEQFSSLESYIARNKRYPKLGKNIMTNQLYFFCKQQRQNHELNNLTHLQISLLESLSDWKWVNSEVIDIWMSQFEKLQEYVITVGKYPTLDENKSLYQFFNIQIIAYRNNKLSNDKIDKLRSLPHWSWKKKTIRMSWNERYEQLKQFIIDNDRLPTSTAQIVSYSIDYSLSHLEENTLYNFFKLQQALYKKFRLSKMKIDKLNLLPHWTWPKTLIEVWFDKVKKLRIYIESNGHYPASNDPNIDVRKLYRFFYNQQMDYIEHISLSNEQRKALESISGWSKIISLSLIRRQYKRKDKTYRTYISNEKYD